MRRPIFYAIGALVVLSLIVAGGVWARSGRNYRAHLSGPAEISTLGQGQATFQFDQNNQALHYRLNVANIENVTQAHIHLAPAPGGNGPVVLWLYPSAPPPQLISGRSDGVLMAGVVTSADLVGPLAGMTLADLKAKMDAGLTYVNVHTSANPGGEIRGDIR